MKKKWIAMSLFVSLFSLMTIKVIKDQLYVNKIEKKFLLNGTPYKSDGPFDYYELQDGEYKGKLAVSLKEDQTTDTFSIPKTFDEKEVIGIYSYGFANRSKISVEIPDTIQVIDYEAFFNTSFSNTKITIPYSVKEMGTAAFFHTNIQNLVFSDGTEENVGVCQVTQTVEENKEEPVSQLKEIPDFCFAKCRDLSLISFSNSLKSIKEEAFEYCSSLKTVAFLNGLESLGNRAFNCCSSLKEVYLPSTILSTKKTSIGEYCFTYCDSTLNFKLSMDENDYADFAIKNTNWDKKGGLNPDTTYSHSFITGDVYANGSWLYNLQTVGNGQSVNLIRFIGKTVSDGNMAFPDKINEKVVTSFSGGCIPSEYQNQIEHIFFPLNLKFIPENFFKDQQYSNLTYIGSMSGNNCYSTKTVRNNTIDLSKLKNLTTIGNSAFCFSQGTRSKFKTLELPANLETIQNNAFNNFNYVTEFSIDSTNRTSTASLSIGQYAFYSLGYYTDYAYDSRNDYRRVGKVSVDLVLPKETHLIGSGAFQYANCLRSLTILGGTTNNTLSLGDHSFYDCNNLQKVVIRDRKVVNADKKSSTVTLGSLCFARWNESKNENEPDYRDYSYKPGLQVVYLPNGVSGAINSFDRQIRVSVYFGGNAISLSGSKLLDEYVSNNLSDNTDSLLHSTEKTLFKFDCPIPVYENVAFGFEDPDYSSKHYVLYDEGLNEGTEVVNNCAYLLDITNKSNKTAILTKYRFDMQDKPDKFNATVMIPKTITINNENYTITKIGDCAFASSDSYAFYNNNARRNNTNNKNTGDPMNTYRTINTLYLPDSIEEIGKYAFFRCAGLEKVQVSEEDTSVPSKLKEIGYLAFAFSGLTQLLNLNADCTIITNVDNPSTNNVDNPSPFLNCPNLEKVTTKSSGSTTGSHLTFNERALFNSDGNILTVFPNYKGADKNFAFSSDTKKFHFGAFKAVGWITSMIVSSSNFYTSDPNKAPDPQALFVGFSSIEEIRTKCVFKGRVDENASQLTNNVRLETLELRGNLGNLSSSSSSSPIPDGAFMKSNIKKIILPYGGGHGVIPSNFLNSVTSGNANGKIVFQVRDENGYLNNTEETPGSLDLLNRGYTTISSNAFSNTSCLTSINLNGVTTIGEKAFSNSGLTGELVIPETVELIDKAAFEKNLGLKTIEFKNTSNRLTLRDNAFSGCTSLGPVLSLKGRPFTVRAHAFSGCSTLESLSVGSKVTEIGEFAFEKDFKLAHVSFDSLSPEQLTPENNLKIGDNAFSGCTLIGPELNLTGRTFDIGNNAFSGCNNLKKLIVGEGVTRIGDSAFENDSSLHTIEFKPSDKLTLNLTLGNKAFSGCTSLGSEGTQLTFTRPVTLGESAFSICGNLKSVNFSDAGVNSIGQNCFYKCTKLEQVNFNSTITSIGKSAFDSTALTVVDLSSCTQLKELNGFSNCTKLTTVIFPKSITSIDGFCIGDSCFLGCTSLTKVYPDQTQGKERYVYLPSYIKTISQNAFSGCTAITRIDCLAVSLTIGDSAFSGCTSLEYFVMDTSGTFTYGSSIFSGCTSLSRVVLPKGFDILSKTQPELFTGLTQFANDSYVCLNNDYTTFGDTIPNWMKINGTQNVKYAFKEGAYKGELKPADYKEWKWNGDNIDIISYSNSTSNSILFFEAEKRFSL